MILHTPLDEATKLVLHLGELGGREAPGHSRPERFDALRVESGPLGRAEKLAQVGLGAEARAGPSRLRRLLGARPEPRGQEAEVGERSPDGGGLGVLETGNGVDLAIAHALGGPARGGRLTVVRGAVDGGAEDDLLVGVLNQLGEDAAGGYFS